MKYSIKKIIIFALSCMVLCTIFNGCTYFKQGSQNATQTDKKLRVIATIFPQYDFVRQIAGDKVDLSLLLTPGSESHSFEPTPKQIIDIQKCDVFIYVGGESDEWVKKILSSMDTKNMKIISLMDCVHPVEEESVEGMQEEHDHHDTEKPEYDEHVWTSPKNAIEIVNEISKVLCELDPAHNNVYQNNTKSYVDKLHQLDQDFQRVVDQGNRKKIIFGDRFPFRYFTDTYQLRYYAAFPGCSTDTEENASTVAFLINKVKIEKIPVVFHIELSNEAMTDMICEATGAKKALLHACHNISKKDFENGETYLSLMQQNVKNLKEALS